MRGVRAGNDQSEQACPMNTDSALTCPVQIKFPRFHHPLVRQADLANHEDGVEVQDDEDAGEPSQQTKVHCSATPWDAGVTVIETDDERRNDDHEDECEDQ